MQRIVPRFQLIADSAEDHAFKGFIVIKKIIYRVGNLLCFVLFQAFQLIDDVRSSPIVILRKLHEQSHILLFAALSELYPLNPVISVQIHFRQNAHEEHLPEFTVLSIYGRAVFPIRRFNAERCNDAGDAVL